MKRPRHAVVLLAAALSTGACSTPRAAEAPPGDQEPAPQAVTTRASACDFAGKTPVSLTYDDAMPTQLSTAVPALAAHRLRATFFVTDVRANPAPWAALRNDGHELAAHTFNHPCPGTNLWVAEGKGNEDYDLKRMAAELDEGLSMLQELGQPAPYTFAYPCGETWVGDPPLSYVPLIEERFLAARGVAPRPAGLAPDFMNIPTYFIKSTATALIAALPEGSDKGAWVVFGFHGIGGDWETISAEAHEELLQHLDEHRDAFHVAPFGEIAACLKEN